MNAVPQSPAPRVGIIMGSQSDWPTMQRATELLEQLQVPHECKVVSAHRTPARMVEYAGSAADRGLLAAQILSLQDPGLRQRLAQWRRDTADSVSSEVDACTSA